MLTVFICEITNPHGNHHGGTARYCQRLGNDNVPTGVFTNSEHPGKEWTFPLDTTLTNNDPMNTDRPGLHRITKLAYLDAMG